jgi:hypothetical protein
MPSIAGNYNPDAEPSADYTPLPAGEYTLEIVESEYKATQSGTGMVLGCKAQIVGGDYDGRPFYLNYDLENQNDIAVEIGQRDFAGLRRATGVVELDDSEQLHWRPFRVKIGVQPHKKTGELQNVVKQYLFDDALATKRTPGLGLGGFDKPGVLPPRSGSGSLPHVP